YQIELGRAQRYVFDIATNLPPEFEPVVMLGGDGELKHKLLEHHIKVISIPGLQRDISFTKELLASAHIYKIIKQEKPDILHVNSSKAGGIGALLGRTAFIPRIIFTAHGWAFNEDRSLISKILIKYLHWLTVVLSHHTIAVSRAIYEQMDWPGVQNKMVVIYNGRSAVAHLTKEEARQSLVEHNPTLQQYLDDLWTGTIAELHPIKRHDLMIEAVKRLTESGHIVRHIIIGGGELHTELEKKIAAADLREHIFLLGPIHEAASLLKAFDIFTLTSRSEALAYTAVEAAQAERPMVVSNVGGLPEVVINEETGLIFTSDSVYELTKQLERLITTPELRATLAAQAYERSKTFSLDRMIEKTLTLYSANKSLPS
ncbi:MAG: glycosyltransferase, partial [Patescibacteria group bacterium]